MNEMVDRVARAIFNHMFAEHERGLWGSNDRLQELYLDCARTAIAAMREPTTDMIYYVMSGDDVYTTWQTMIDEALK